MPKTRTDGTPVSLDWMRSVSTINSNGCWIWGLFITKYGYGRVHVVRGTCNQAHRISYELAKGPIPTGFEIDHLCRIRSCINPDHLEAVPPAENFRRGAKVALFKPATSCRKGHIFGPENPPIIDPIHPTRRTCKICRDAIVKKWNDIGNAKNYKGWTREQRLSHMAYMREVRRNNRLKSANSPAESPAPVQG